MMGENVYPRFIQDFEDLPIQIECSQEFRHMLLLTIDY